MYTDVFCMCVNVDKKTKRQEKEEKKKEERKEEGEEREIEVTQNQAEKRTQNAARAAEIEGRTRSLWPSSIRIPRISVNGPLLPRPFG